MLLQIRTTRAPATDLGYLLHKHPARMQQFELAFGRAHVFYPEAEAEQCTAALLLDVDPIGLVRGRRGGSEDSPLAQYVNDRPYVASSFLSVAIAQVFGSALAGKCAHRPELVGELLPLEARLEVVPVRGGEAALQRMFAPLGYELTATRHVLDGRHPEWGSSPYFTLTLRRLSTLQELLSHLYVLIPVLDDEKHYFIGEAEVEKLLRHGEGWLREHPARDEIALRYLRRRRGLARLALERLREGDEPADEVEVARQEGAEQTLEQPLRLNELRLAAVRDRLRALGARSVLDLGCGEGRLLEQLLRDGRFARIVGFDTSYVALERASARLRITEMPPKMRSRIELLHGSLTYRDERLAGFDAAVLVEVIEHIDLSRLAALERVLFEHARPGVVLITTPNAEYNARFGQLPAGRFRHRDHRFEWTRPEFAEYTQGVATRWDYTVTFEPIGDEDPALGAPTQMAVFQR